MEFKGTSDDDWLKMQGHYVKEKIKRLKEYKKNNKNTNTCPFMGVKK
jgi:hypothetical protein